MQGPRAAGRLPGAPRGRGCTPTPRSGLPSAAESLAGCLEGDDEAHVVERGLQCLGVLAGSAFVAGTHRAVGRGGGCTSRTCGLDDALCPLLTAPGERRRRALRAVSGMLGGGQSDLRGVLKPGEHVRVRQRCPLWAHSLSTDRFEEVSPLG